MYACAISIVNNQIGMLTPIVEGLDFRSQPRPPTYGMGPLNLTSLTLWGTNWYWY